MLSALHETINIMTLGGLALAVGILVDDATVAIENIDRNLAQGKDTVRAILDGAQQIAVPALVSTLCICIVFVPMFFLTGVAKFLFVPLAEAVVFAMLASYLLSRTLVPTMAMYLLKGHHGEEHATGNDIFSRVAARICAWVRAHARAAIATRWPFAWITPGLFVALFLVFCVASAPLALVLGRDFFPTVDAGLIRLHMRARAGQRVEETAREADGVDNLIRRVIPPEDLGNILDNIGLFNSTINTTYSNSGVIGESDAEILIGLKPERKMPTKYYIDELRERLAEEFPGTQFFFQPADMVSQILNFGVPAPDRYSAHRPEPAEPTIGWRSRSPTASSTFPARWTCTCSNCAPIPTIVPECRPHPRAIGGPEPAGRGQQPAAHAEFQLPDQSLVLGESGERHRIQRGRAGAAIQDRLHAIAREYSDLLRDRPRPRRFWEIWRS